MEKESKKWVECENGERERERERCLLVAAGSLRGNGSGGASRRSRGERGHPQLGHPQSGHPWPQAWRPRLPVGHSSGEWEARTTRHAGLAHAGKGVRGRCGNQQSPHTAGEAEGSLRYAKIVRCLPRAGLTCTSQSTATAGPTVGLLPSFGTDTKPGLLPVVKPLCLGLVCQVLWASG